jgi:hypothetical protein
MTMVFSDRDAVLRQITEYVRTQLLDEAGAEGAELAPDSPLLQWGVLNSMNTARLLTFLREEMNVFVPPTHITGRHFQDLNSMTDLVILLDQ